MMLKHMLVAAFLGLVTFPLSAVWGAPISGSIVWLDAQDIDNDGNPLNNPALNTPVSSWVDKSGVQGSQTATQANASLQPLYVPNFQNGQAAIQFNGDILSTSSYSAGPFTTFTAFRSNSTTAIVYERSPTANSNSGEYMTNTTGSTMSVNRGGQRSNYEYTSGWGNSATLLTSAQRFDGTHAGHALFVNGTSVTLNTAGSLNANPGVTPISDQLHIGARLGQVIPLNGHISEMLVYGSALSNAETNIVNNYLSAKYDSTMTSNDLYAGDNSGIDYDFHVFGIGSEADGTLSTNSFGSGLTLTEANASLTSGEYLLAGIDDSSPSNIVPSNVGGNRLERSWYLDKTGALDATITFNLDDLGVTFSGSTEFSLLYRSGLLDDFTNLGLQANQSGQDISFLVSDANLADGFYTLAFAAPIPEPSSLFLLGLGTLALVVRPRRGKTIC